MTRTWWENEEILRQFRDWLSETSHEIEALDDEAAQWSGDGSEESDISPAEPETGLLQVVEALTAMRHEVKLQTKSGRGLEESVAKARQGLDDAIRQFRSVQAREEESADRAALPLAEAMAGLDEAVWRAGKAFETTHRQMTEAVPQRMGEMFAEEFQRLPRWRRWLIGRWRERIEQQCAAAVASVNAEEFARLLEGYRMIQQRLRQELEKHGLRRIAAVGRPVDPACMSVVALADLEEGPPETVVEELRPGYRWRDKVIRFAEVRAVASRGAEEPSASTNGAAENSQPI